MKILEFEDLCLRKGFIWSGCLPRRDQHGLLGLYVHSSLGDGCLAAGVQLRAADQ